MAIKSNSTNAEENTLPRWQRLLKLDPGTYVKDISTGLKYTIGQFDPVYTDGYQNVVETFKVKGLEEYVSVRHLRLLGDGFKCSLMAKKEAA